MKILQCDVFRFSLPLRRPLALRDRVVAQRDGLLVRLTSENGRVGVGEASPLVGFSGEHVYEALDCLEENQGRIVGHRFEAATGDAIWPETWWNEWPSSVRMALDLAALELAAEERGVRLARLWNEKPADQVALNALVAGGDDLDADLTRVRQAGYRAVKLKVGRRAVEEEAAIVKRAREMLGDDVDLRLDANRAWNWDDAVRFASLIAPLHVAYLEEPLRQNERLPELAAKTGVPLALDETLGDTPLSVWMQFEGVRAVVLKPTLLGGLSRCARIARRAAERGLQSVVSSSFESGVALTALLQLASAVSQGAAAGLDTYRWLKEDLLQPRLPLEGPTVDVSALSWDTYEVNESLLQAGRHGRG